jgi:hypothetical protein
LFTEVELRHHNKSCYVFIAFVILVSAFRAQTLASTPIAEFPPFKVIQGNVDSDGWPISGAKLCLLKPADSCYQMPSNSGYSSSSVVYDYGINPHAERLPLKGGGSIVLFSAQFSGGGSGSLDSFAILRYKGNGKIVNLLPFVGVTNQSDHAIWFVPQVSNFPILVTADFIWMDGETHFAKHFYTVSAYRFDDQKGRYIKAFSYRTSKKHAGLDDETDQVNVLGLERENILRRLK